MSDRYAGCKYNITFKKLADTVGKSGRSFELLINAIIKEWHEAGICPRIRNGKVVE